MARKGLVKEGLPRTVTANSQFAIPRRASCPKLPLSGLRDRHEPRRTRGAGLTFSLRWRGDGAPMRLRT